MLVLTRGISTSQVYAVVGSCVEAVSKHSPHEDCFKQEQGAQSRGVFHVKSKSLECPSKSRENKHSGGISREHCRDITEFRAPRQFPNRNYVFYIWPPSLVASLSQSLQRTCRALLAKSSDPCLLSVKQL